MSMIEVPAHLLSRPSRGVSQAAMAGSMAGPPRVSLENTRFTLLGSNGEKHDERLQLDAVIVDVNPNKSRKYYEGKYVAGSDKAVGPTCSSLDGKTPDADIQKPKCTSCALCPLAQWKDGVAANGGRGTECKEQKRIAVVVPDLSDEVYLVIVPSTSIRPLAEYSKSLMSMSLGHRPAELSDVVTRITFADGTKQLAFKAIGFIDARTAGLIEELDKTDATGELVGRVQPLAITAPSAPLPTREPVKQIAASSEIPGYGQTVYYPNNDVSKEPITASDFSGDKDDPFVPDFLKDDDEVPHFPSPEEKKKKSKASEGFGMMNAPPPPGSVLASLEDAFNFKPE